jgi:hypothetical protein
MTLNRQDSLGAGHVGVTNRLPASGPPEQGELGGYLLGWLMTLVFCSGLIGLAVLPPWGMALPRWLLLVYGAGCGLLTVLAMYQSRPWQQRPGPTASSGGNRGHHFLPARPAGSGLPLPLSRASASRRRM